MTKKNKKQKTILNLLQLFGQISVQQAVEALNASEATVRRLFAEMEAERMLLRFHGGVRQLIESSSGYNFEQEVVKYAHEKQQVGSLVAELVKDGDRLFLDAGTTSRSCGLILFEKIQSGKLQDIVVVTNSLAYTDNLAKVCPVFLTGGRLLSNRLELVGNGTLESLQNYRFSKAILGTDGITEDGEILSSDENTAQMVRLIAQYSSEVYILADAGKLGRPGFVVSTSLVSPKFTLVTNAEASMKILQKLKKKRVHIIRPLLEK